MLINFNDTLFLNLFYLNRIDLKRSPLLIKVSLLISFSLFQNSSGFQYGNKTMYYLFKAISI